MNFREEAKALSEKFHGEIHLVFGMVVFGVVGSMYPGGNFPLLLALTIVGTFLPDIDHLFFMYGYGRKTEYATLARKYVTKGDVAGFFRYCKKNHKSNTEIISHNLITPVVFFLLGWWFVVNGSAIGGVFWWSMSAHFVFDVLEDLLFFGRLNGNWYLKYGKRAKE